MASPDLFDAYFRRADTDGDGRISGKEAVAFFQGANLNREVLAKIWQYADQGQTGFLSRQEFYNALKLVTVAQTGRELTPAIVSRALTGPAASQIPPPQIQFTPGPPASASIPAMGQPSGVRPVQPTGPSVAQYQQYPAANVPSGSRPLAPSTLSNVPAAIKPTNVPSEWPTNKSSSWSGPASNSNISNQLSQVQAPQNGNQGSLFASSVAPKAPSSGQRDLFGGDVFTAVPPKPPAVSLQSQVNLSTLEGPGSLPVANQAAQSRGVHTNVQPSSALVPSSFAAAPPAKALQPVAPPTNQPDHGMGAPAVGQDGLKTWPKMTDAIVRRYTKIFFEVDTDKDGKISGAQARDLFLSWHLPREILKQIWDLSDQDRDSMLSLREFCVALYLMERHREGRVLSAAVPANFCFDDSGLQALRISEAQVAVGVNSAGYNLPAWQQNPSVLQSGHVLPPRPTPQNVVFPGQAPVRPPMAARGGDGFIPAQVLQPKSKAPVEQMKPGLQKPVDNRSIYQGQEAVDTEKKSHELEKHIMDSKEKMEYYRSKMQDIVLFKTRCDNRLAEITDKAAADKREVEAVAKRYEEKYKQTAESQSRLLAEEAAFRDIQERKVELHSALVKMTQGGDLNAFLQARADRLQMDLCELKKALTAKCKQAGLKVKPISLIEIPFGWQPGIQETAAQWDDTWDTFEDEGFTCIQEFMEDGSAGSDAQKPKTIASWDEAGEQEDGVEASTMDGQVHAEVKGPNENKNLSSSPRDRRHVKEDEVDTPSSSRHAQFGTSSTTVRISTDDENNGGEPAANSVFEDSAMNGGDIYGNRSGDVDSSASWGKSDTLDTKAFEDLHLQPGLNDPFKTMSNPAQGNDDLPSFGPIRTRERPSVFFDNSVPSTPLHTSPLPGAISSKGFFDESVPSTPLESNLSPSSFSSKGFFDESVPSTPLHNNHVTGPSSTFARFDSFSSSAGDFGRYSPDSFTRFDSFNHGGSGLSSFDERDPFASTGPFGGGQTPRHNSTGTWSAFG